jgi:hypothetical protein
LSRAQLAIELVSCEDGPPAPSLAQPAIPPKSRHELHLSLHPDFALDATATSLVGSRAKLQDVPKIEQLLVGRLRSFIHDRFVWPKYWTLTLPNLIPRSSTIDTEMLDKAGQSEAYQPGQGDSTFEEEGNGHMGRTATSFDNGRDFGFFESAPPLFPPVKQPSFQRSEADSALPGSLPTVEAWRSQAAATGVQNRSRFRQDEGPLRSGTRPAFSSDARHRNAASVNSSTVYT